ncbi:uncharacterized protein J3R85_011478 [Psidium guajava]|nr:uncharacterized protein J3R85_011478 [Psidium guajava]
MSLQVEESLSLSVSLSLADSGVVVQSLVNLLGGFR